MAPFDQLISDVGSRFSLGPKAEPLIQELFALIKDSPDGMAGFLNKFKTAGFGDQVASWLGDGAGAALSGPEVEKALGAGIVPAIASKLGLGAGTVGDAIGYALPKMVGALTPGGAITKPLPASVTSLLTAPALLPRTLATPAVTQPVAKSSAGLWPVPLLLLIGVGLLTYYYPRLYQTYYPMYKDKYPVLSLVLPPVPLETPKTEETATAPPAAPPATPAPAPAATPAAAPEPAPPATPPPPTPTAPAQLKLEQANGALTYAGTVDSAASRDSIVATLTSLFGADHVKGDLAVDQNVVPPSWLTNLKTALALFKFPTWRAAFDGSSLDVHAPDAGDKLADGLKSALGSDVSVTATSEAPAAAASDTGAEQAASTALAGLQPGFSGADLVAILNKYAINFDTSSATISDASKPILKQAAELMKQLPHGAKVHIDGYTDSSGDPAGNLALSRRRANAVRALLIEDGVEPSMLRARGHGAEEATAGDNRNDRRIEFSVH